MTGTDNSPVDGRRSTIKDVAAEANVSISTVSLVMNDKGSVSADTRDRVLDSARRLGYVPTTAAKRLVAQKTGNIGFVLREDHFTRSEPFYTRIFLGTEFEARLRGVYVLLTTIPATYSPVEHGPRFLRERNVDGMLVAGKVDEPFVEEAVRADVPVVLIDFEARSLPSVVIDNQGGTASAVEHLIQKGHRRIAFMAADLDHPSISSRLDGYRLALARSGAALDDRLLVTARGAEPTRATGARLAETMVAIPDRPTAVFCANDAMALGVLDFAQRNGIDVPGDLAVIGFDDVPGAASSRPALSTVRVFKEQLGELALRYLLDLIDEGSAASDRYQRGSHAVKISTELVIRDSS